jgi:hypothetical protein
MEKKKSIAIGWIDPGTVQTGFAAHLAQILLHRNEYITSVFAASGPYLSLNRNNMIATFLQSDAEWLLSVDSDICLTIDNFDALIAAAEENTTPIVGGKYYLSLDNIVVAAQKKVSDDHTAQGFWVSREEIEGANGKLIENLHSVGIGLCIIHRDVFRAIQSLNINNPLPWFKDGLRVEWGNSWSSDDLAFFEQVRALNINISLHTGVTSQHLKMSMLNDDVYLQFNPPHVHGALGIEAHKNGSWWTKSKKEKKSS